LERQKKHQEDIFISKETSTRQELQRININHPFLGKVLQNPIGFHLIRTSKVRADFIRRRERKGRIENGRVAMNRNILGFMYAERLKSALIIAGKLLDVLPDLDHGERSGGLKMFGSFVTGVGNEMRLAANVMGGSDWDGLSGQLDLMEGYARLGQMEAARQELSQSLSRVTTLGTSTMTSLKSAGLL
jgi:hypothetical protein